MLFKVTIDNVGVPVLRHSSVFSIIFKSLMIGPATWKMVSYRGHLLGFSKAFDVDSVFL